MTGPRPNRYADLIPSKKAGRYDDLLPVGNPFEERPAVPILSESLTPTVARPATDATGAAFHSLDESGAAYAAKQRRNIQDAKGLAATAVHGATLHLADDVLPKGFAESVDYLKRRSPAVAGIVDVAAGLAVPGVGGAKAFKALAPTGSSLAGRTAAASLIGGTGSGLLEAGDTEGTLEDKSAAFATGFPLGVVIGGGATVAPAAAQATGRLVKGTYQNVVRHPVRSTGAVLRGAGQLATGKSPTALLQLLQSTPLDEAGPTVAEAIAARTPSVADDVADLLGPKRLGPLPPPPAAPRVPPAPAPVLPSPTSGLPVKYPRPAGPRVSTRTDGGFAPLSPKLDALAQVVEPPPAPAAVAAPSPLGPKLGGLQAVVEEFDDPIVRQMAEQVKRGKPTATPKVGQPVGPKLSRADRVAAMKARSLAGDVVKESELNGLTLAERIEARGGQQALDAARASGERQDYGSFLTKHSQGSAQRRGELAFDARVNAEAKAQMEALQAAGDAAPDEATRDQLYTAWKQLKDEFGKAGPATVAATAGAGAAVTGLAALGDELDRLDLGQKKPRRRPEEPEAAYQARLAAAEADLQAALTPVFASAAYQDLPAMIAADLADPGQKQLYQERFGTTDAGKLVRELRRAMLDRALRGGR